MLNKPRKRSSLQSFCAPLLRSTALDNLVYIASEIRNDRDYCSMSFSNI
jgi:hypothetical protein